jgi:hypothetical protein
MKKNILLSLTMMLSANILFLVDNTPTSIKESAQMEIREEGSLVQIRPAGAWFTRDDELL